MLWLKNMENQIAQQTANNGWQNIGICYKFARENIQAKYVNTYMAIVEFSFGFGYSKTNRKPINWWIKKIGISKPTFLDHIHWLSENDFIKIISHREFVDGGGSSPFAYSPIFPKGYGTINLFKEGEKDESGENAGCIRNTRRIQNTEDNVRNSSVLSRSDTSKPFECKKELWVKQQK